MKSYQKSKYRILAKLTVLALFTIVGLTNLSAQSHITLVKASSSTSQKDELSASAAVDDDPATRWSSARQDDQWIEIELKDIISLETIGIIWENAYAKDYKIQVGQEAGKWEDIHEVNGKKNANQDVISFSTNPKAKFIRINCVKRATKHGFSIYEIKLNGKSPMTEMAQQEAALMEQTDRSICSNPALLAEKRAQSVLDQLTLKEKKKIVSGYRDFFVAPLERFGLRSIYMTDASAGMHIRGGLFKMDKSIAYPSSLSLAATWDPELGARYGAAVASECRAWGADVLLGPGFNIYRNAQCGRSFEYMGEDPFLVGQMASGYVKGIQSKGIMATAKHFLLNNHEWLRHESNVIIDARTIREIYARPWYRVIHDAKVGAVMTSYNAINGEKASQNKAVIQDFLLDELGFSGLTMSDWRAVYDTSLAIYSGVDLIMPKGEIAHTEANRETVEKQLDRMVKSTLTACFKFGYYDRPSKDESFMKGYPEYEALALETARKAITLLKNRDHLLPLVEAKIRKVIVTGPAAEKTPHAGGGSGHVVGYDHKHILAELAKVLGDEKVAYIEAPTADELKEADAVVICVHTEDKEGFDRLFSLEKNQEKLVKSVVEHQPNSIVVLISGTGIRMTDWHDKAGAIITAYHSGQYGGTAIAEILTGKVNPSGKLPMTIEKEFSDSPAFGYKPAGTQMEQKRRTAVEKALPKYPPVPYKEGIFVGYRWYDNKKLDVRYAFGHGLSYTSYEYSDLKVENLDKEIKVKLTIENSGERDGAEVVQIYFQDLEASVPRPLKELCGFKKIELKAGESKDVTVIIYPQDLAFYDVINKTWKVESGDFKVMVGASSRDIRLNSSFKMSHDQEFAIPVPE